MTMKVTKCPECGGQVRPVTGPGRMMRHYTMRLEVPDDIAIPTCVKCGERFIDRKLGAQIDKALDQVYRTELREKAQNAINALLAHATQHRLEALLGLSVGYLSKVKTGEKDPSPQLVAVLALLAMEPARLTELEDVWGGDPMDKPDENRCVVCGKGGAELYRGDYLCLDPKRAGGRPTSPCQKKWLEQRSAAARGELAGA